MAMNANKEGFYGNEFNLGMGFSLLPNQIETSHFMNQMNLKLLVRRERGKKIQLTTP